MTDYESLVPVHWRDRLAWGELAPELRAAIGEFGFYMYRLGAPKVGDIDAVKYDGRLVVLDDGSRWEVSEYDAYIADMWSSITKVVVLDDVMYNLDDAEHVDVTEEI
ncbi:hypothetical protein SBE55_14150 [Mycolicibacterium sp. 141076]|uniref:hypothetical protein n=1 Tax=Mycolicibacterium sp. 141076 TaxID=3090599 RepID=UPI00299E8CC3|nr:hypothetical protein [Mycolicibacterium sp. 141076]MDX1878957.1 hypothetical protein [Mycolicibacterium sp. 141076]